tara:strand:+ start:728 stop:1837 length:1110 start_codon:yes stop_codon:yes gene_type:complete
MAVNKNFVVKNGIEVGTRVIVADAQDAHVGLGTTAPLATLDVKGDVRFGDDGGGNLNFVDIAGITTFHRDVNVGTGNTTVRIDNGLARVGINSASPRFKLDVRVGAGETLAASFDAPIYAPNVNSGGGSFVNLNIPGITTTGELYVSGIATVGTAASMYGTFAVTSLTNNRVPIVGAGSTIEDDANLTYDGSRLAIGNGLSVGGGSTFTGNIDANGDLDVDGRTELDITNISETLNVVGVSTFASAVDINSDVDIDGHTELDNLNVSGVSTFVGVSTFNDYVTIQDGLNVTGAGITSPNINVSGVVTATSFVGEGQIGVGSEGTFIGAGVTMVDFKSTNSSNTVDIASGIATVTVTTGVSLGLVIALGS